MRVGDAAKMFGGSLVIYVAMAACGASNDTAGGGATMANKGGTSSTAGVGGAGATGGTVASTGGGMMGSAGTGAQGVSGGAGAVAMAGAKGTDGSTGGSMMNPVKPAMADAVSGTRVKVNYFNGADGSKQWALSMRDTLLDVDCYFSLAADGVVRCLPSTSLVSASSVFADAGCSQPLAYAIKSACPAAGAAPKYAFTTESCGGYEYSTVTGPFSGSTPYQLQGATCAKLPASISTDLYDYYTVGAPVPLSTFVSATKSSE